MKMNTLFTRLFVIIYAVACITVVSMENNLKKECSIKNEYWFSERMAKDAMTIKDAECIWLIQATDEKEQCVIEGFAEEERVKIDGEILAKILDTHFYIEQNENVALGMFFPIAMVAYHVHGLEVHIVYSFMNAEARIFVNGKLVKTATLYDARKLNEIFEKL